MLDQLVETLEPQARTRGRVPRGQAARAASDGGEPRPRSFSPECAAETVKALPGTKYGTHPALSDSVAAQGTPPRELSSYQHILSPASTGFVEYPAPHHVPVATLAHSLERVLFNPGVHFLRDPRSGVYNFTRDTLENVPKISEFDFSKLPQYVTSSKDEALKEIAASQDKKFSGSTSSTVGMLCQVSRRSRMHIRDTCHPMAILRRPVIPQIYFWLSKGKLVHLGMLSGGWQTMASLARLILRRLSGDQALLIPCSGSQNRDFSMGQKLPVSVVLRYENGRYAIDADKSFDPTNGSNVLADYVRDMACTVARLHIRNPAVVDNRHSTSQGHLMEKLLTTEAAEFKRFLHGAEDPAPSEADHRQAYHYSLVRSRSLIRFSVCAC